jgi:hypothetical protein
MHPFPTTQGHRLHTTIGAPAAELGLFWQVSVSNAGLAMRPFFLTPGLRKLYIYTRPFPQRKEQQMPGSMIRLSQLQNLRVGTSNCAKKQDERWATPQAGIISAGNRQRALGENILKNINGLQEPDCRNRK